MRLLAGDVGGTKTLLALYEERDGAFREVRRARFDSPSFAGLGQMVRSMLGDETASVDRAAFGIAGPIVDDTSKTTNLPWHLDARALEAELGIERIRLLNDFQAVALGVPSLGPSDVVVLQDGEVEATGPVAILGAGTGLGEAFVVPLGGELRVLPSEGGHADFSPRDEVEIDLLRFLMARHGRVSVERVVSGQGIVAIYDFLVSTGLEEESPAIRSRMTEEDPAAVIGTTALEAGDRACERTARMFTSLYGAEAGNLALKVLPTGGLYVAGGIAPKLLPLLRRGDFLEGFLSKGRMRALLERIHVSVITDPNVGLYGARNVALRL